MKQKQLTRAQAERLVASTDDEDILSRMLGHPNPHVRAKVAFKRLGSTEARRHATDAKHLGPLLRTLMGVELSEAS